VSFVFRPDMQKARKGFAKVRAILHGDWDPIGCGVPEDEYDDYVWPTLALLKRRAPRAELKAYLVETANVTIGCPVPDKRLEPVLDKLMALDV
jgi:hypothetical protein